MRWIGQAEFALERMIWWADSRYAHGSMLSEKQGIQWMIPDSVLELYQSKLMVLHAAYRIEHGLDVKGEVSMAKYHVATTLWSVVDRAVQVHATMAPAAHAGGPVTSPSPAHPPCTRVQEVMPRVAAGGRPGR